MKRKSTNRLRQVIRNLRPILLAGQMMILISTSHAQFFTKIDSGTLVETGKKTYSASWGDYNNDGFDDMVIVDYDVLHTSLFKNNQNGTFDADTNNVIFTTQGPSIASVWGDYDNDGNVDLFICNTKAQGSALSKNFLFRNEGDGIFTRITEGEIVNDTAWSMGAAWADYDNDGYLDLFVSNFMEPNNLYHNNGDGTFAKITEGEIVTDEFHTYSAAWSDYNNDGFQDLFVVNYYYNLPEENDSFYENNGDGTFTKKTSLLIVNDSAGTQSASWGDFNNDGWMDLFITVNNLASVKHNFLYVNDGMGDFTLSNSVPSLDQGNSFGSAWLDFNNDGFLDLTVSNNGSSSNRLNFLYLNNGDETFTPQPDDAVTLTPMRDFCSTVADYNHDGYSDIFTPSYSTSIVHGLYQNNGGTNNYISIRLEGVQSNRSAIGARLKCYTDGMIQSREVSSNSGMYCGSSFMQIFGLGNATMADSITIDWPSGIHQVIMNPTINSIHEIIETNTTGVKVNIPASLNIYPNPSWGKGTISIKASTNGKHNLEVINQLGQKVLTRSIFLNSNEISTIGFEGLSTGLYLIRLQGPDSMTTSKLIISK